jgi:addiction module RelE/StbE family toxin
MRKVQFSPRAKSDFEEIFLYIAEDNPLHARNVVESIEKSIAYLREFSYIGTLMAEDIRMIVEPTYRYRIFYRVVDEDSIHILSISKYQNSDWKN